MPPNTESQPVLPPDKNLTFTQFFTKLLIKVPKVDIEKLPSYLLRDHLMPDKDYIEEHEEDKDDIYSLEHQENVEEFKPKDIPAKFIKPIKLKKLQPNRVDDIDPPAIEVVQTEVEKEKFTNSEDETDSITCTVEESEFICFEEESLDLTVSDEFTEDCVRENNLILPEEDEKEKFNILSKEHNVPGASKSEDENSLEKEQKENNVDNAIYTGQDCEELLLNLEQDGAVEEKDICQEEKRKDPIIRESGRDKVELSNGMQNLQRCSDVHMYFANEVNMKSDSNKSVECETPVEPKGGEKEGIAAIKLKTIENLQDLDYHIVNSGSEQEYASNIASSNEQRIGAFEDKAETEANKDDKKETKEYVKDNPVSEMETFEISYEHKKEALQIKDGRDVYKDNDSDMKGYVEDHPPSSLTETETNKRQEKIINNQRESILTETETATAMDFYGCCSDTDIQDNKPVQKENEKEVPKQHPSALKIRIFKVNTGELINNEESWRAPKRKKKIKDQAMKMIKLAIPSQETVENDTQSRIIQELPGCNWLEQKIRNCESSKNVTSQPEETSANHVDELLETDSGDDHLVVDDQADNSEVSTTFPHADREEIIIENEFGPMMKVVPEINRGESAIDVSKPTQQDWQVYQCGELMDNSTNNNIKEIHPFKYILGNLMKKMDDNKSTGQPIEGPNPINMNPDTERSLQNEIKTYENGLTKIKNNKGKVFNQAYNKRKTEESKQLSFQNRPAENNRNIFEQYQSKLKPIKYVKATEVQKEKQSDQTAKVKPSKQSYERRMEEATIVCMNSQNLHYQQQMLENKKIKEQLVRDIEDLKNKKIKEMEDLIEIKTKKEQNMTYLEKLKTEILKNKAFLSSLKKINVEERTHTVNPKSSVNTALSSGPKRRGPKPILKQTTSLNFSDKQLPDLVNHEKLGVIEKNDQIQTLILPPDYLNYLQRTKHTNSNASNPPLYQAITPPPYPYNNQPAAKQHRTPIQQNPTNDPNYRETVQAIAPNNSRPHLSSQPTGHQQHVSSPTEPRPKYIPPTIANDQNSILATHFNSQQFCPSSIPVSITRVGSSGGMMRIQSEDRRKSWENTPSTNVEAVGYLRPGEFSREAAATSPTKIGQFMNSSNNQYPARNFAQTLPNTPNQQGQKRQGNIDFPEIQSALASSTVSPDCRAKPRNIRPATQTQQNSIPQCDNPTILSKCCVCNKVANFLCSGCQKVYYCTVQCQRNHWLGHYAECRGTRTEL